MQHSSHTLPTRSSSYLHTTGFWYAGIAFCQQRVNLHLDVRRQRFGYYGSRFSCTRDVRVHKTQEADGAAAVVVVDGCALRREGCNALRRDSCLLPAQLRQAVRRTVQVVLSVPEQGEGGSSRGAAAQAGAGEGGPDHYQVHGFILLFVGGLAWGRVSAVPICRVSE